MSVLEIDSDQVGKVAYRRESYGGGRFRVVRLLAGAGQGYALLTEDTWCGGMTVLKGLWWDQGHLRDEGWRPRLDRNKAQQQQGLKAVYQAMQVTQQAPPVIDVLPEPSPTLEASGVAADEHEYFVVTEFVGIPGRPVRTLEDDIKARRREKRPFTEDELIDLAEQLCGALGALHARRPAKRRTPGHREEYWIHADLKPENVLVLGPPEQYILIDYDAAVVDGQPISTTTPAYSPPVPHGATRNPELDKAAERFDIYMLGATLAEALGLSRLDEDMKRQLYGTAHEHGVAKQRLAALGGSPILTTLIASCLAEPAYRTRNVQSIQADLARARDGAVLSSVLLGAR
ncbi:phosphotransferase [Actinomadura formosensis]|uniref:phosphotransferase n=1 Tax=Actinomadura formosensis TaxID=60706 RepID=UPI000835937A|nr:phosphotransferase [Actinomadura formosensis]